MASKPFEVPVTGERELAWAKRVVDAAASPEGLLRAIGDDLIESTKLRFISGTAPDGRKWAPNRPVTLAKYAGALPKSLRNDDGSLNKKGLAQVGGKRPLIGHSRMLGTESIAYDVNRGGSAWELIWGSKGEQAAMMQFGGKKSQFPHLWGDIPARPFMGISSADMAGIEATTDDWLDELANTPR